MVRKEIKIRAKWKDKRTKENSIGCFCDWIHWSLVGWSNKLKYRSRLSIV